MHGLESRALSSQAVSDLVTPDARVRFDVLDDGVIGIVLQLVFNLLDQIAVQDRRTAKGAPPIPLPFPSPVFHAILDVSAVASDGEGTTIGAKQLESSQQGVQLGAIVGLQLSRKSTVLAQMTKPRIGKVDAIAALSVGMTISDGRAIDVDHHDWCERMGQVDQQKGYHSPK